jgi:hypothetical protein
MLLKLRCDRPLSNVAFNSNLCHYTMGLEHLFPGVIVLPPFGAKAGWCRFDPRLTVSQTPVLIALKLSGVGGLCRLTTSKLVLNAPMVSALETITS